MDVVKSLVPMAFVQNVSHSIEFYRQLGFEVKNTFATEGASPTWASLESRNAHLMLAAAGEPVAASTRGVLFYLYCDEVEGMRRELLARGIGAGAVTFPFYAPRGEFRVEDPDGYVLMITHT